MNNAYENLLNRRSCRKYLDKQVEEDVLDKILLAGTFAPTGRNGQSPFIVALQKKEDVAYLQKLNAAVTGNPTAPTFYGAPTVVVVFGDKECPFGRDDANLVIANILNAANALGVDSCYIWRARESFDSPEGKALKEKWGIPERYEGVGNVILGYGEEGGKRPASPRKDGYVVKP